MRGMQACEQRDAMTCKRNDRDTNVLVSNSTVFSVTVLHFVDVVEIVTVTVFVTVPCGFVSEEQKDLPAGSPLRTE